MTVHVVVTNSTCLYVHPAGRQTVFSHKNKVQILTDLVFNESSIAL